MHEGIGTARQINPPHTIVFGINYRFDGWCLPLEIVSPAIQRASIMPPQVLDIDHLQPPALHVMNGPAQMRQLAVREHVLVEKFAGAKVPVCLIGVGGGNAMVHGQAIVLKQFVDVLEIPGQVFAADMLEHTYARDSVELSLHIPVILQADFDAVLKSGFFDPLSRQGVLLLGQRDTHAPGTELVGRAQHQSSPAAANIQQRIIGLNLDLGKYVIDFLELSGIEILIAVLEVGAGIHHVLVQPQLIEIIGNIVVELDGLEVFLLGMGKELGEAL